MKNRSLFNGATICFTALDATEDAPALATWTQDSRYIPLFDHAPPHPMSMAQAKKLLEDLIKEADEKRNTIWFGVRTRDESELLGIAGLSWVDWSNGVAHMVLSMKDPAEYGRSSTEETLALMQQYVFNELQMHRLNFVVPAYNEALIAILGKKRFVEEVRRREALYRFGRRWDSLHFGVLATDCEKEVTDD